jgi:hypothetical protein
MPTYTINGQKFKTDRELTEAELEELAASVGGTPSGTSGQIPGAAPGQVAPAPVATMSAQERAVQNALAGAAAVPPLAAGARGLQALFQGTKFAPYLANFAKAVMPQSGKALVAEGVIGAGGGVVGGEVGQQVAQKFGEQYRPLGEMGGGMVGGIATNTAVRNLPEMAAGVMASRGLGTETAQVSDMLGSVRARNKLQTALEANPSLGDDLAAAKKIETTLGVKLPISAASKGDTTLTGLLASETSRGENAAFTALIKRQEDEALAAVKDVQKRLAGDPRNAELRAEAEAKKVDLENARRQTAFAMRQENANRRVDAIDERIATLSNTYFGSTAGKEDIGNRVRNLLDAKEAAIKKELSPQYTSLLDQAKKDGVELDSTQVAGLWKFIKSSKAEDVFAKFPALYPKITSVFAPKPASAMFSPKFAERYPNLVRSAEGTYKPAPIEDIDSLKRALNKAIGSTNDSDQLRMLFAFKKEFDNALSSLPEEFVTSYRNLDKEYAKRLGIPFSEAGVVSVDKARFVENVVPQLTTKSSAVRQILAASDNAPEAVKIVEDAFMMKIGQTQGIVSADGVVNPAKLRLFVDSNKETIDQVPGLRQRLLGISQEVGKLKDIRASILEQQKNAKVEEFSNVWSQAFGSRGGFEGYVERALQTPAQLNELILLAGTDKNLHQGLKSAILDIGMKTSDKTGFFNDNIKTLNTLFGPEYSQQVKMLLDASQRLAQFPVRTKINQSITQQTGLQQMTGSKPEQVASEIRNPVLGTFRTAANILSRFVQNRASKSEAAEIQEFLSNPSAVADASALVKELEKSAGKATDKAVKLAKKLATNSASAGIYGGLGAVVSGETGLSARQPIQQFEEEQ